MPIRSFALFRGTTFILNFTIPALTVWRGETIVEIKKFVFFEKRGIFKIVTEKRTKHR